MISVTCNNPKQHGQVWEDCWAALLVLVYTIALSSARPGRLAGGCGGAAHAAACGDLQVVDDDGVAGAAVAVVPFAWLAGEFDDLPAGQAVDGPEGLAVAGDEGHPAGEPAVGPAGADGAHEARPGHGDGLPGA